MHDCGVTCSRFPGRLLLGVHAAVLGGRVLSFVDDRAAVVQSAVAVHRVVDCLDVVEDRRREFGAVGQGAPVGPSRPASRSRVCCMDRL